jgi:hypothetical protein
MNFSTTVSVLVRLKHQNAMFELVFFIISTRSKKGRLWSSVGYSVIFERPGCF